MMLVSNLLVVAVMGAVSFVVIHVRESSERAIGRSGRGCCALRALAGGIVAVRGGRRDAQRVADRLAELIEDRPVAVRCESYHPPTTPWTWCSASVWVTTSMRRTAAFLGVGQVGERVVVCVPPFGERAQGGEGSGLSSIDCSLPTATVRSGLRTGIARFRTLRTPADAVAVRASPIRAGTHGGPRVTVLVPHQRAISSVG